jgi:hypothetical protein
MYIPFRKELDELFQTQPRVWLKMIAGAFVALAVGLGSLGGLPPQERNPFKIGIFALSLVFVGMFGVLCLSLKDTVRRRIENGKPVSIVLRAYFASGILSLILWLISVVVLVFVVGIVGFLSL